MKIIIIASIFFTITYAQSNSTSIDGWDKTKWGMSKNEIKELYGNYSIADGDTLQIDNYEILNLKFTVSFIFINDSLMQVRLQHKSHSLTLGITEFNKFEEQLVTKYGAPIYKNEEGHKNERTPHIMKSKWVMPKTNIEFTYVGISILNLYSLILQYRVPVVEKRL